MRTNNLAVVPAPSQRVMVEAEIDFLVPGLDRPFTYGREAPHGGEAETARFAAHAVQIEDLRHGDGLALEEHGAQLGWWPTRIRRFYDEDHVQRRYYPECAEIIKTAVGADQVVVFDHNVRRGSALQLGARPHSVGRPVHHAHTDYTPQSALRRLHQELGPQAESGLSRYLQVNLWRPIRGPLRDAPLAICDGASIAAKSLRTVELRYPDRTGEIYYLLHDPQQRWYFASDMTVDEAWLFKNFDSSSRGPGRVAPHSAFTDSRHRYVPPRESIEVRALALFH
ncbi:MAG TPA: CmcJ/NvfI family oxidoreductase [Steroidobacteraceae bacterium]